MFYHVQQTLLLRDVVSAEVDDRRRIVVGRYRKRTGIGGSGKDVREPDRALAVRLRRIHYRFNTDT